MSSLFLWFAFELFFKNQVFINIFCKELGIVSLHLCSACVVYRVLGTESRASGNLKGPTSPSILSKMGSLAHCCWYQTNWPASLCEFSCLYLSSLMGELGLQTYTVSSFMWILKNGPRVVMFVWTSALKHLLSLLLNQLLRNLILETLYFYPILIFFAVVCY